jgi:hypothetical protein
MEFSKNFFNKNVLGAAIKSGYSTSHFFLNKFDKELIFFIGGNFY